MDNYRQKLFLICALLFGCLLTSIGVEYLAEPDEPIRVQAPNFVEQEINKAKPASAKSVAKATQAKALYKVVNINTATLEELDTLPGVGPAIAKRIVAFRSTQSFAKIEDIMLVKGIGKKKFAKIRERITVE